MKIKIFPLIIFLILNSFVSFSINIKVKRVIDGDTFEVETGEKVRLIGINAPESKDIFGIESKMYLTSLVEGKIVNLISDENNSDKDRYNRLLRYVFIDSVDINKKMIQDGFAFAYLKYSFFKSEEYKTAQLEAKENKKGMWADNDTINESRKKRIVSKRINLNPNLYELILNKKFFILLIIIFLIIFGIYYYYRK